MLQGNLSIALLEAVTNSRIATLEISDWLFDAHDREVALTLLNAFLEPDTLRAMTIHARFGSAYDLSSLDPETRQRGLGAIDSALDLARTLNAPIIVVHASAEPIAPDQRRQRLDQAREMLVRVSARCQQAGKQMAVELLPRTCLGNTVDELWALLEGLDRRTCGVCLDTNHLMDRHRSLPQVVRRLGDRLLTLHLSDYDGIDEQHALPGQGVLDWRAFMQALQAIDYAGPFNYESRFEEKTIRERIERLENNFDWLSALMSDPA